MQAIRLPSGETVGFAVNLSVSRTGSPPSIETFQSLSEPERAEGKTTQRLSGEERAMKAPGPSVSRLRLPPSGSMRQMDLEPTVWWDEKIMWRLWGVAHGASLARAWDVTCFLFFPSSSMIQT